MVQACPKKTSLKTVSCYCMHLPRTCCRLACLGDNNDTKNNNNNTRNARRVACKPSCSYVSGLSTSSCFTYLVLLLPMLFFQKAKAPVVHLCRLLMQVISADRSCKQPSSIFWPFLLSPFWTGLPKSTGLTSVTSTAAATARLKTPSCLTMSRYDSVLWFGAHCCALYHALRCG